ncbi:MULTISPECIES: hypothetical protein [unclassified Mesorhizobium]|uniref:hypothetical protein n=1 Tax=unclassified Mesorhizobium TaxID=325217 RepID=UPI0003CE9E2B|nr:MULTISPECIES: hypothetical protein [unclassified Mesorhizobium]ESW84243.1 hypothetical protein X773_09550 [Mesorhizobium sp. LSJC285A00]ESY15007.1 hypothetical protein X750_29825 [Mesorhizobium sp. LNJC394B00]
MGAKNLTTAEMQAILTSLLVHEQKLKETAGRAGRSQADPNAVYDVVDNQADQLEVVRALYDRIDAADDLIIVEGDD